MRRREEGRLKVRYSGEHLVQGRDTAIGDGRSVRNTRIFKVMSGTNIWSGVTMNNILSMRNLCILLWSVPSHARSNWD